jgi:mRNA-degrading endonuclease RelE of RelBE toxin-antitoxin system
LRSTHEGYGSGVDFIEARPFSKRRPDLMTEAEYDEFKQHLAAYPDAGDPIKCAGGIRKIRWANSQRGKGKRSGSRTIYLHVDQVDTIHLLTIYDHEEQDDLSAKERKELGVYAHELKALAKTVAKTAAKKGK